MTKILLHMTFMTKIMTPPLLQCSHQQRSPAPAVGDDRRIIMMRPHRHQSDRHLSSKNAAEALSIKGVGNGNPNWKPPLQLPLSVLQNSWRSLLATRSLAVAGLV